MRSSLLIVVVVGLIVAGLGLLTLGAFPPRPHTQTVQKVLPNDRFQTR